MILDHAGCVHEHGLPDDQVEWTLDGHRLPRQTGDGEGKSRLRRCPECSAVHAWASECIECGYVYGVADRTINEVYGDLREVSRPSGNHHPKGFSPGTFESREDFAARVGRHRGTITKWCDKGLPRGPNGWIEVDPALAWIDQYLKQNNKAVLKEKWQGYLGETTSDFAARIGRKRSTVNALKNAGLPTMTDGTIDVEAALAWLSKNDQLRTGGYGVAPEGCESAKAFAIRVGVSGTGGRRGLLCRGLPVRADGFVDIQAGLAWISEHGIPSRRKPKSGVSGVTLSKSGRFVARGNGNHLGTFATIEEATTAVSAWRKVQVLLN